MNTRFSYLYRDACNYKKFNDIVISGHLEIKQVLPFLKDNTFFIPSEIGLDDLQESEWSYDDHIWHEIEKIEQSSDMPTVNIKAESLLKKI